MNNLKKIESNIYYHKLLELINTIGTERFKILTDDYGASFLYKSSNQFYDFEVAFWLDANRVSFNIRDWVEVADDYIENEQDAIESFEFIETILQNKIIFKEYGLKNKKSIYKKSIEYTTKIQGKIELIKQDAILKIKFPWQEYVLLNSEEYSPVI